jgi:uncharacterized protein (DUF433 family)
LPEQLRGDLHGAQVDARSLDRLRSLFFVQQAVPDTIRLACEANMAIKIEHTTYADRIVQDPAILSGRPVVKGTRISVEVVLDYLANNTDFKELFADYPRLTMDDVKACFAFAQALVELTPREKIAAPDSR